MNIAVQVFALSEVGTLLTCSPPERRNGQEDGLIKQVFDYTPKWSVSWEGWWMAGKKVSRGDFMCKVQMKG